MKVLNQVFFDNKEAAALPGLLESGGLPALVSGLSAVHRAHLGAALREKTGRPLFVICPDDTAAENMARDLSSMLGEEAAVLGMREDRPVAFAAAPTAPSLARCRAILSHFYTMQADPVPQPDPIEEAPEPEAEELPEEEYVPEFYQEESTGPLQVEDIVIEGLSDEENVF